MTSSAKQSVDVCIVGGAGHVGLPMALVLASKGLRVLIQDHSREKLDQILAGEMPFAEDGAQPLLDAAIADGMLTTTTDAAQVGAARTLVVTIGTPVDEFLNPDMKVITNWAEQAVPYLADDQLIILRSTVYPGTTRWLTDFFLQRGKRVGVAYCPERIVQGFAVRELQDLPQIISGTTAAAVDAATAFFSGIAPKVVPLDPMEAEFAKLFANAYRYILFATANQFYMIANSAGVDYNRILDGLQEDYPRAHGIPRAGFAAGPCLLKDTMQLAAYSRNRFSLGHSAMLVNEGLAQYVVDEAAQNYPLDTLTVGLLGMAFKADCDDVRSSLSYKLKKLLQLRAGRVLTTDPHVSVDPELVPLEDVLAKSDLLILCTPHSVYSNIDPGDKPMIDVWGYFYRTGQRDGSSN